MVAENPLRTCVGCRLVRVKADLVRLAVTGDPPRVTLDLRGRLAGRGAYLCRQTGMTCLREAKRRRSLARSLRVGNDVIDEAALGNTLERLITEEPTSPRSKS
jgi:predicted RNA-binding protein YlxR (DUF448 family)